MTRSEREHIIQRYLSGEMSSAEEGDFFIQVALDRELRHDLQAQQTIESAFRKEREAERVGHTALRTRVASMLAAGPPPAPSSEPVTAPARRPRHPAHSVPGDMEPSALCGPAAELRSRPRHRLPSGFDHGLSAFAKGRDGLRRGHVGVARPERRFRVVFHVELDALRGGSPGDLPREIEAEVDARRDAAAGYPVAVDADAVPAGNRAKG